MFNSMTLWGLLGAVAGLVIVGTLTFGLHFFLTDQSWFSAKIRASLILIGGVLGFILASTGQVVGAQYSEAVAYQNSAGISYAKGDLTSALNEYNQAIRLSPK